MARPLRLELPGATYHVTSRGNTRQDIFLSTTDRLVFLGILGKVAAHLKWNCVAYCLMDNHYHLLLKTEEANLAQGMRQINGVYSQYFNREHDSTGHLFQGRYGAVLVEVGDHLLEVARYVVSNPVRARMVRRAEEWRWSSLRATLGMEDKPEWLVTQSILGRLGKTPGQAIRRFAAFVREKAKDKSVPWDDLTGQVYYGSEAFVRKNQKKVDDIEIPRAQRKPLRRKLQVLLPGGGTPGEIESAYREGYRLVEIARHLGVHYTTVSQRLKRDGRTLYVKT